MGRKGLGLYRQDIITHDKLSTLFLLECWLVNNGTIKVSVGRIENERNGEYSIKPVVYREFDLKEHENYKDLYIHAMNYTEKIKKDWQYLKDQLIECHDSALVQVSVKENPMNVNIINKEQSPQINPEKVATDLVKGGTDFNTAVKVKGLLDEQISNNINSAL